MKRALGYLLSFHRDNDGARGHPVFYMAASLRYINKALAFQDSDDLTR